MNRTRILRWSAAAALLMGGVATAVVVTGQTGRILNLFSTKSVAQPKVDSANNSGSNVGAQPARYAGRPDPRRSGSTLAAVSNPPAPPGRPIELSRAHPDDPHATAGSATKPRLAGDKVIEFEFAPHANTGGAAGAARDGTRSRASENLAQARTWTGIGASSLPGFSWAGNAPLVNGAPATSTPSSRATSVAIAAAAVSVPTATREPATNPAANPPSVLPSKFVQTTGKTIVNNVLNSDTVDILGGRLGGNGTIQTTIVTIGASATLGPGNSPGVLTINGNLHQEGVLEIEIAGTSATAVEFDVLHVTGDVTFAPGSVLKFVLYDAYHAADNDEFEFLTAHLIQGLENLTFAITGLPAGFGYQVYSEAATGETDLYVRFYSQAQGTATPEADQRVLYNGQVPEPSTLALNVLGLALLGWRLRRRKTVPAPR